MLPLNYAFKSHTEVIHKYKPDLALNNPHAIKHKKTEKLKRLLIVSSLTECLLSWLVGSGKLADCSQMRAEGFLFNTYYNEV